MAWIPDVERSPESERLNLVQKPGHGCVVEVAEGVILLSTHCASVLLSDPGGHHRRAGVSLGLRLLTTVNVTVSEFHLVSPGAMSVQAAHASCDELEQVVETQMPRSDVSLHVDPESKAKQSGVPVR